MCIVQDHLDSWSLLACQHFASHEWGPEQKKFEQILQRDKGDAYAIVGIGNIWLEQLHQLSGRQDTESRQKHAKLKQRALDFYLKVMFLYRMCYQ